MRKPVAYVLVGLPASGKSTQVEALKREMSPSTFVYSTDAYIEEMAEKYGTTYNDVFDEFIKEAGREMNQRFQNALAEKRDIIWDQTNLTSKKRWKILRELLGNDYYAILRMIQVDSMDEFRTVLERNDLRDGKKIPSGVMINMIKSYEEPTLAEGWHAIETVSVNV